MEFCDVSLGEKYVDVVSGLQGVATGKCEYQHLTAQVEITPRLDGESKSVRATWVPIGRLSPVKP